jgi:hypothetical protein
MTYIDIVNNVLRRLREDEVSTVSATTYSKMVGDFVNDAKTMVEDAWDWSALRRTLVVTTNQPGVFSYILVGTQNRGKVLDVVNNSSDYFLEYQTAHWFNNQFLNNNPITGSPYVYSFNGVDDNGDTKVDLYPIPDQTYDINFNMVIPQADLSADSDRLKVPAMPVVHLAVALLARERGETGGTSTPEYFAIADKYLSDAIALDASKHAEEVVWYY